jgi:hypothetical protein
MLGFGYMRLIATQQAEAANALGFNRTVFWMAPGFARVLPG